MPAFPRWLDKARATGARLIKYEPEGSTPAHQRQHKRKRDADYYADIPPFLLPLSVRVRLDKEKRKARSAPYDKTSVAPNHTHTHTNKLTNKRKLKMPTVLKRLAGPPTCPIVVAQYKDEYRGVGHEPDLHWALVVITDRTTLSGLSFQAYSQKRRVRRASRAHRSRAANPTPNPNPGSETNTNTNHHGKKYTWFGSGTNAIRSEETTKSNSNPNTTTGNKESSDGERAPASQYEYEIQWYTRCAPASLYDVSATVRSLCLGGVQVGAVRRADVDKLAEYLRSHPPVPRHRAWSSREYVLELVELLRPFKMLRADLQSIHLRAPKGAPREVGVEDLLPDLREVGRATQESIFQEEFRPCVKYSA